MDKTGHQVSKNQVVLINTADNTRLCVV